MSRQVTVYKFPQQPDHLKQDDRVLLFPSGNQFKLGFLWAGDEYTVIPKARTAAEIFDFMERARVSIYYQAPGQTTFYYGATENRKSWACEDMSDGWLTDSINYIMDMEEGGG